jgi:hypothetical protein
VLIVANSMLDQELVDVYAKASYGFLRERGGIESMAEREGLSTAELGNAKNPEK